MKTTDKAWQRWFRQLCLVCVLCTLPTAEASPVADYATARENYIKLKADEKRSKLRQPWQAAIGGFEAVAKKHPNSPQAADASFSTARLYAELAGVSGLREDREAAFKGYQKFVATWPKHRLADDAAFEAAKLASRLGNTAQAHQLAQWGLAQKGDMQAQLKAFKQQLPPPPKVAAPPSKAVAAPPSKVAAPPPKPSPKVAPPAATAKATPKAAQTVAPKPAPVAKAKASPPPAKASAKPSPPSAPPANAQLMQAFAETGRKAEKPAPKAQKAVAQASLPKVVSSEEEEGILEKIGLPSVPGMRERLREVRVGGGGGASPEEVEARLREVEKAVGASEVALSQQLGLKARRIVIDAGHGGHDSGAVGPSGLLEKDVTLDIALKLSKKLKASGYEVFLTRSDDRFVKLEDRTRFANKVKGDVFISIHCNASPNKKTRGIETYTLNVTSDRYATRLAARENAGAEKGIGELQFILADLTTKANTVESGQLARSVQSSLVSTLVSKYKDTKGLGHREALFFVLLGAKMPSILVEVSFLSNAQDEKLLANKQYRTHVADGILEGIKKFTGSREQVAGLSD